MSMVSSSVVSAQFPAGLRVLVVDDDPTCLEILERMLRSCLYEVTKCNRAEMALSLLRENRNGYDVVISEVHMPDMDGFKFLEQVALEMALPVVIMMSADDSISVVMKGVTHGACDYLIKPVRIEALKNIWQHVVRRRENKWKEMEQSGRKDGEEEAGEKDNSSTLKKPRVVWSVQLHQQFVAAVNQLGIDKAVPKKILDLMNVPGLTRENVASHLQKYRVYLRRLSAVSRHQNYNFINPQEGPYVTLASVDGPDLKTLAATDQFPAPSLATLQTAGLGQSAAEESSILMPLVDQRNLEWKSQYVSGSKQVSLLPTTMEPKQLGNSHHSAPYLRANNVQPCLTSSVNLILLLSSGVTMFLLFLWLRIMFRMP